MKKSLLIFAMLGTSYGLFAQIQTGTFRTTSGNTDYHHFTRNGGDGAVYINQVSTNSDHAILRLSSGTDVAGRNIKFTVENNGSVGIGTTNPTSKLFVYHESSLLDVSKSAVSVYHKTNTDKDVISYDTGLYSNMGHYSIPTGIIDKGYKIGVNASSFSNSLSFAGTLQQNIGLWARAGIYKATPGAHIKQAIGIEAQVLDAASGVTIDNVYGIRIRTNDYKKSTVTNRFDLYASTATAKNYFAGNVGIGTEQPGDWKLAVNGKIRAKEIKVETGWSDFVFFDDYKLPTLKEVEKHINTYGHLKDIPSAKEVEENGIQLGEMNSKLLQKIEELTLYTIQQDKKIETLQEKNNQIDSQQQEIDELKALVKELLDSKE